MKELSTESACLALGIFNSQVAINELNRLKIPLPNRELRAEVSELLDERSNDEPVERIRYRVFGELDAFLKNDQSQIEEWKKSNPQPLRTVIDLAQAVKADNHAWTTIWRELKQGEYFVPEEKRGRTHH